MLVFRDSLTEHMRDKICVTLDHKKDPILPCSVITVMQLTYLLWRSDSQWVLAFDIRAQHRVQCVTFYPKPKMQGI